MAKKNKNLEFLNKLSILLSGKISPVKTIGEINKLFKSYLNIEKSEFIV